MIREVSWGMTETHTCDTMIYGFEENDFYLNSQPVFVGFPVVGTEFKICDFETGSAEGSRRRRRDMHPLYSVDEGLLEKAGGKRKGLSGRLVAYG